jgi:hypothetical protein
MGDIFEQGIQDGKDAGRRPGLSCRSSVAKEVRPQPDALAHCRVDFLRILATHVFDNRLTNLKTRLIRIGPKVVSHGRYIAFQMANWAVPACVGS